MQIKTYPVSYPTNRKGIACSGQDHSSRPKENCCCVDQRHLCSKCDKEKCNGQCCERTSECLHPCQHPNCGSDKRDCSNINYVCCDSCGLCLKCTLVNLNLSSVHELVGKIVSGERIEVCNMLLLRLSISFIEIFRNLMSHLTTERCKAIDNGAFSDSKIPQFCKSWVDIQELFQFAIQQILDYLKSEDEDFKDAELNQHMEFMRKVTTATRHTDLDIYTNEITKYLILEQFSLKKMAEQIHYLKDQIVNLTSPAKKSLKLNVEFDFKKNYQIQFRRF